MGSARRSAPNTAIRSLPCLRSICPRQGSPAFASTSSEPTRSIKRVPRSGSVRAGIALAEPIPRSTPATPGSPSACKKPAVRSRLRSASCRGSCWGAFARSRARSVSNRRRPQRRNRQRPQCRARRLSRHAALQRDRHPHRPRRHPRQHSSAHPRPHLQAHRPRHFRRPHRRLFPLTLPQLHPLRHHRQRRRHLRRCPSLPHRYRPPRRLPPRPPRHPRRSCHLIAIRVDRGQRLLLIRLGRVWTARTCAETQVLGCPVMHDCIDFPSVVNINWFEYLTDKICSKGNSSVKRPMGFSHFTGAKLGGTSVWRACPNCEPKVPHSSASMAAASTRCNKTWTTSVPRGVIPQYLFRGARRTRCCCSSTSSLS